MEIRTRAAVAALATSNFITVLVNTILFPIFPALTRELGLGLRELSFLVMIVSFTAAVLAPVGGYMADRWGRKWVMIISLLLYGGGGLLGGLAILLVAHPYWLLLLGRFLQGVGTATPMYLTTALAGDMFQSKERTKVMGYLETGNGLGKVFSPILGSVVGLLVWYGPFFLYPVVAIPVAIFIWVTVKEPQQPAKEQEVPVDKIWPKLKNPSRILALLAGFITLFLLIGVMFWLSDILDSRLQMPKLWRGFVLAMPMVALVASALVLGYFTKEVNPRRLLGWGLLIMAVSTGLIPFVLNSWFLWAAILLLGAGAGLVLPPLDTIASGQTSAETRGILTTIYGGARSLGAAVAPYSVTHLLEVSVVFTFGVIGLVGAVLAVAMFLWLENGDILPEELQPQ